MSFSDQLKSQLDIVDVVSHYVRLKRQGSRWVGLCPFHSEKTPSFGVHSVLQYYKCFGCDAAGDVFKFVQEIESLTFPETLKLLAERYGIPINSSSKQLVKPRVSEQTLSSAWLLTVGLRWLIERSLEAAKLELWSPQHEPAARTVKTLTDWQASIDSWTELRLNGPPKDPRSFYEIVWRGRREQQEAVDLLGKLPRKLVRACIGESEEAELLVAHILAAAGAASEEATAA